MNWFDRLMKRGSAAETGVSSPVARVTSQDLVPGALAMDVFRVTADDVTGPVQSVLEIEIADEVGHTRLLSRLGDRVRFFPTPFWSDRDRPEVLTEEFRSTSVLDHTPRVPAYGATAWVTISLDSRAVPGPTTMPDFERDLRAMKVDVELDEGSGAILREALGALPDTSPLVVLTGVSAEMPRCLTWKPGQEGMSAISDFDRRADSRCAGNFVAFAPDQAENGARVIEDGFALLLRTDDWRATRKAILEGRAAQARDSSGRLILEVSWKR